MHLGGSNLNLNRTTVWSNNRCMQRLVKVGLWRCNVVLKTTRHWVPQCMNSAKCRVAISYRVCNDAQGDKIVDVGELSALADHLLINGPQVLRTSRNLEVSKTGSIKLISQSLFSVIEVILSLCTRVRDHARNALVLLWLKPEEGQILKLPLNRRDTQTISKWRIHVHGFSRLKQTTIRWKCRQRAHIVKTVGKLDDNNADVL